jgi:uroporphyrinogen decarboxylase
MNKRERVYAALDGRSVDRVPFTMWRHFYYQAQTANGLAQSTLDFYRRYNLDLIVLAPGSYYMAEGWGADVRSFSTDDTAPYIVSPRVARVSDWRHLPALEVADSSLVREVEAVGQIRSQLGKEDAPLIVPLYSPLTTADLLCNGRIIEDVQTFSNDLRAALGAIADATSQFALACLDAGADGYMFISRLASQDKMRKRAYRDFGEQYDLQVLNRLRGAEIRILHLGIERPYFDLASRYPVGVVCWETWRADPSLSAASNQFRGALMGGLNPMTFSSGSVDDIQQQIADAIEQTGGWRFVLAPSGPLPADSREEMLAAVHQTVVESQ